MKNGILAIVLLIIGFIGGYAAKGLLVGMEQNNVTLKEALQEVKNNEKNETEKTAEEPTQIANETTNETAKKEPPVTEVTFSSHPTEALLQKDFTVFKTASEGYLNSLVGKDLDPNAYNVFLEGDYKLFYDKQGTLYSNKKDAFGNHYLVFMNPKKQKIVVQSNGEGKGGYVLASYQQSGNIESCTRGFNEGTWNLSHIFLQAGEVCGGDLK